MMIHYRDQVRFQNRTSSQAMKMISLISRLLAGVCTLALILTTNAADLHVPAGHSTVQAAIDASSDGDTIHIAAGVYTGEDLGSLGTARIIRKNLSLIGQPGTIFRAVPSMGAAIPGEINWRSVLFAFESQNVTLKNVAFEGEQLGDQQGQESFVGAYYLDSGGSVENCRFTGFRERVPNTVVGEECCALQFFNDLNGASLLNVRVIGNTIEDSETGILLRGAPDVISYDFLIENNTISGVGPTSKNGTLRGIETALRAVGTVADNTVSGFSYTGSGAEFPYGYGLIAYGSGWPNSLAPLDPIRFEGNVCRDNNVHMIILNADEECPIVNNRIEGSAPKNRPAGLWVTGRNVPVYNNDFRNLIDGIRLGGEDDEYGTVLEFAEDIQLEGNRFTDVENRITYQEGATATETNNLTAPFPDPELNIDTSVTLSWPAYYENWSVESSPNLEDWMRLDLPVRIHGGMSWLTVPANESLKTFRLVEESDSQ